MNKLILLFVLVAGSAFAQTNEVFGNVGLAFPRTPEVTATASVALGYGRTVATESFGETSVIGTYNFSRQTPVGGMHSFLGGVKQSFNAQEIEGVAAVVPFLTLQIGEATLLNSTKFASQIGAGIRVENMFPQNIDFDLGVTGTSVVNAGKPFFAGLYVGIAKSF